MNRPASSRDPASKETVKPAGRAAATTTATKEIEGRNIFLFWHWLRYSAFNVGGNRITRKLHSARQPFGSISDERHRSRQVALADAIGRDKFVAYRRVDLPARSITVNCPRLVPPCSSTDLIWQNLP